MSSAEDPRPLTATTWTISRVRRRTMVLFTSAAAFVVLLAVGTPVIAHQVAYVKALGYYQQSVDAVDAAYARLVAAHAAFEDAADRAADAAAAAKVVLTDADATQDELDDLRAETQSLARRAGLVLADDSAEPRHTAVGLAEPLHAPDLGETPRGMHPLRDRTAKNDRLAADLANDARGYEIATDAIEEQLDVVLDLTDGLRVTSLTADATERVMLDLGEADLEEEAVVAAPEHEAETPAA